MKTMFAIGLLFSTVMNAANANTMSKKDFISASKVEITKTLCRSQKFLNCSGDSESLCKAQLKSVILPQCLRSKTGNLPNLLNAAQLESAKQALGQCIATLYPTFNHLDPNKFASCMAK